MLHNKFNLDEKLNDTIPRVYLFLARFKKNIKIQIKIY